MTTGAINHKPACATDSSLIMTLTTSSTLIAATKSPTHQAHCLRHSKPAAKRT